MFKIRKIICIFVSVGALLTQTACHRGSNHQAPVAIIDTAQPSVAQVTTYLFSSAASTDSDGKIVSNHWDFGDGSTSDASSPSHIFAGSGTYIITLTLKDDRGASASITQPVTISTPAVSLPVTAAAATVNLPQSAVVSVPADTFTLPTQVGIWSTADAETAKDFDVSSAMFGTVLRAVKEIRINTGKVQPSRVLTVTANIPAELEARLQLRDEPKIFVQIFQDGGEEVLDSFELLPSTYDPTAKTLRFDLDPDMLTDSRTADATWEAVFVVGSTRTKPASSTAQAWLRPGSHHCAARSALSSGSRRSVQQGRSFGAAHAHAFEGDLSANEVPEGMRPLQPDHSSEPYASAT